MLPTSFYKRKQGSIYFSHYFCVRLQIHTQCSNLHGIISIQSLCRLRQDLYAGCGIHQAFDNQSTRYRQILAVTFTNKATAEMKERILTQLYGIWKGAPSSEAYLERIKNYKLKIKEEGGDRLTDGEIRQRAGMALQYMLHDYSRFRVETIDSFFQSVMRNLARELELSPNLNIELNNSEVLSDAVDSLIEKLTPTSPVLAWLLDYIDERIRDDKRWNVSNEVKSFGRNIFDESYIERGEKLRQCLRTPNTLKLYRDVLRDMETEALEQMKSFYDQFEGELEGHALTPEDLKGGARGIGSYFRKLRDGRLSDKDVLNAPCKTAWQMQKTGQRKHPHERTTSSVWQKPA